MGSEANVTIVEGSADLAEDCLELMEELEQLWSRFRLSSELSRLSRGERLVPDARTRDLLVKMRAAREITEGAFDPTLLREIIEVGYSHSFDGPELSVLPSTASRPGGLDDVDLSGEWVQLPAGLGIDPGGIGKGAAADAVATFAIERGAAGVLVNMGGDIAALGEAPDQDSWRIAVEDPFLAAGKHLDTVRLRAGAVATSSQLKRRFTSLYGDQSHLLNPHTRESVANDVVAVTVVAGAAWFAEICTKPGFIWPIRDFLDWLPTVHAAGMLVARDGGIHASSNWGEYR